MSAPTVILLLTCIAVEAQVQQATPVEIHYPLLAQAARTQGVVVVKSTHSSYQTTGPDLLRKEALIYTQSNKQLFQGVSEIKYVFVLLNPKSTDHDLVPRGKVSGFLRRMAGRDSYRLSQKTTCADIDPLPSLMYKDQGKALILVFSTEKCLNSSETRLISQTTP